MLKPFAIAVTLALGLAGCQTTTQGAAPVAAKPVSQQQLNADAFNMMWQSGTAVAMAGLCAKQGVRLHHGSADGIARSFVAAKQKEGYSQTQIKIAVDSVNKERAKKQGIDYLLKRGAVKGKVATVCPIARSEVAKRTGVGSFLEVRG